MCPEAYQGTAFVGDEPWDISSLQSCAPGSTCPVSSTFTDEHFMIPQGCQSVSVNLIQNSVRGQLTSQPPTAANGWRGEHLPGDGSSTCFWRHWAIKIIFTEQNHDVCILQCYRRNPDVRPLLWRGRIRLYNLTNVHRPYPGPISSAKLRPQQWRRRFPLQSRAHRGVESARAP